MIRRCPICSGEIFNYVGNPDSIRILECKISRENDQVTHYIYYDSVGDVYMKDSIQIMRYFSRNLTIVRTETSELTRIHAVTPDDELVVLAKRWSKLLLMS